MPRVLNTPKLEKKFAAVTKSRESIQNLSGWIIHHKTFHQEIVLEWLKALQESESSHRLTLFYVANDVLQHCKKRNAPIYKISFAEVLEDAVEIAKNDAIKDEIYRMIHIWGERNVYALDYLKQLTDLMTKGDELKVEEEEEEKKPVVEVVLPEEKPEAPKTDAEIISAFKLKDLIESLRQLKDEEKHAREAQKVLDKISDFEIPDMEYVRTSSESRHVVRKLDRARRLMKEYTECIDRGQLLHKTAAKFLEYGQVFYSTQNEEVRRVVHAYRIFGRKVKTVQQKLAEKIENMPDTPDVSDTEQLEPDTLGVSTDTMENAAVHLQVSEKPVESPVQEAVSTISTTTNLDTETKKLEEVKTPKQKKKKALSKKKVASEQTVLTSPSSGGPKVKGLKSRKSGSKKKVASSAAASSDDKTTPPESESAIPDEVVADTNQTVSSETVPETSPEISLPVISEEKPMISEEKPMISEEKPMISEEKPAPVQDSDIDEGIALFGDVTLQATPVAKSQIVIKLLPAPKLPSSPSIPIPFGSITEESMSGLFSPAKGKVQIPGLDLVSHSPEEFDNVNEEAVSPSQQTTDPALMEENAVFPVDKPDLPEENGHSNSDLRSPILAEAEIPDSIGDVSSSSSVAERKAAVEFQGKVVSEALLEKMDTDNKSEDVNELVSPEKIHSELDEVCDISGTEEYFTGSTNTILPQESSIADRDSLATPLTPTENEVTDSIVDELLALSSTKPAVTSVSNTAITTSTVISGDIAEDSSNLLDIENTGITVINDFVSIPNKNVKSDCTTTTYTCLKTPECSAKEAESPLSLTLCLLDSIRALNAFTSRPESERVQAKEQTDDDSDQKVGNIMPLTTVLKILNHGLSHAETSDMLFRLHDTLENGTANAVSVSNNTVDQDVNLESVDMELDSGDDD